jgi:hypothetical protein
MLYIDIDAFCKLAHWNLLPFLPNLTGYRWDEIATLSSLIFRARRAIEKPDGKLFLTSGAATCAYEHANKMATLPEPDPEAVVVFANTPQIDAGEAVLFALTAADPNGCLFTGDKRALRALSQLNCADRFVGRILIIEQILWRCLAGR